MLVMKLNHTAEELCQEHVLDETELLSEIIIYTCIVW